MTVVLPWVITCTVTVGAAFCLFLFGTRLEEAIDDHDRTKADLAAVKAWIAETFGGPEPLAVTDPPETPTETPTEPMPAVDLVGGARTSERPVPYKRQAKHRAPVTERGEVEG